MATLITKNSSTASSVPTAAQLVQGELAVNVTDKRLFTENSSGTVVELGTNPSSLALPNGSANGVPYLNGSKVLTTGSALTFNGTFLQLSGAYFANSGAVSNILAADSISAFFDTSSSVYPFRWLLGGSEAMRLTSTGLGIGTSSPENLLQASSRFGVSSSGIVRWGQTVTVSGRANSGYLTWDTGLVALGYEGAGAIAFQTNSLERARIDSSGNWISSAPTTPPTLATNGTMVFNLTSNTNLRVSVRGSDGVTRVANITLA